MEFYHLYHEEHEGKAKSEPQDIEQGISNVEIKAEVPYFEILRFLVQYWKFKSVFT